MRDVYAFGPRGEPRGFVPTPVYRGADLQPGHRLEGPLLVEERTTTVVAGPGDRLEVLPSGDLLIRFDGPEDSDDSDSVNGVTVRSAV